MQSLFESSYASWKKIFMLYYNVEVSEDFLACADKQLSPLFERLTGIKLVWPIRLMYFQEEQFFYEKETVSKINATISLKYGFHKVNILWKSLSGRIYELNDKDIDCTDIQFWFEGLDPELCLHYWKPIWSLITFRENFIETMARKCHLQFSGSFVTCMDEQLTTLFVKSTGIKINKDISLLNESENKFQYSKGDVSTITASMYVYHNWNPIVINWKSVSGRIYEVGDENIDCNDIEFWFDQLDLPLIYSQVYPKDPLPFKLKDLSYELTVGNFSVNCQIELKPKEGQQDEFSKAIEAIDGFIQDYNEQSEKKDRKNGVVHNWNSSVENKILVYELDLGSTGAHFMKKLLLHLSEMNTFSAVHLS